MYSPIKLDSRKTKLFEDTTNSTYPDAIDLRDCLSDALLLRRPGTDFELIFAP